MMYNHSMSSGMDDYWKNVKHQADYDLCVSTKFAVARICRIDKVLPKRRPMLFFSPQVVMAMADLEPGCGCGAGGHGAVDTIKGLITQDE